MSLNQGTYTDEFGDRGDWVEIWNPSNATIDLGGMWFTDDLTFPMKHQIPIDEPSITEVAPGEFKIVWFDKQPGKGPLHVDLALNAVDGERIGFFHSDGAALIDSVSFPALDADVSFGRFGDGAENLLEFFEATPAKSNELSGPVHISHIPNQFVSIGDSFQNINLDEHLFDLNYNASEISWQVSGQSDLQVNIDANTHIATITYNNWQGSQELTFLAENPDGNSAERMVRFSVGSILSQPLTCSQVLGQNGSPYLLKEDALVPAGCSLTIDAGVELHIGHFKEIIVKGSIEANGIVSAPIEILAEQGHWRSLYIDSAETQTMLKCVHFQDGTFGNDSVRANAVVSGRYADLLIEDCTFNNNDRCIYSKFGSTTVSNSDFFLSNKGEKINIQFSTAIVENNYLEFTAGDNDCIDMDAVDGAQILNNEILGGEDDGIDIGLIDGVNSSNVLIRGNIIQGIADKGISIGERSQNIRIERNVILDCDNGIAVKDSSTAKVDHCTIARTEVGVNAFEKDAGLGGGIVAISNCIIDGSRELAVKADALSILSVQYSLSGDHPLWGENNIFTDPRFANESNFEASGLQLSELSPAIDAADPNSPNDPDGSRADMGAYPFDRSLAGTEELISIFPNPANSILNVVLLSEQKSRTTLEIFDVMGRSVLRTSIPESGINAIGNIQFELDLVDLSAGQYVLQVENDVTSYAEKFFVTGR